jgi:hypothetical protein
MINAKSTDMIRIEANEPNGRSVTLTGEQWLNIFNMYKKCMTMDSYYLYEEDELIT